jgi:hypothetical protein
MPLSSPKMEFTEADIDAAATAAPILDTILFEDS